MAEQASGRGAATAIETLLLEERRYPPPPEFAAQANAQPEIYDADFEAFWEREGRERVTWFEPFTTAAASGSRRTRSGTSAASSTSPTTASTGTSRPGCGDKVAYYWEGEPAGERRELTFAELQRETTKLANALKALGVRKGTPVGIYMGMVPETPIAMLACARIGAPHTVVFGGFSADSLSDRLHDMGCEVLITQDEAWRRGTTVPLKRTADEALADAPAREERDRPAPHRRRRADDRRAATTGGTRSRPTSPTARASRWTPRTCSTSSTRRGTTAKPKGIAHTTAGYLVGVATTHHYIFDVKPDSRLLVRGRRRLGHRPQLHRLRPALQRRRPA